MAYTPQPDLTIYTLTNGAQVAFHYEIESASLRFVHRNGANDEWASAYKFDMASPKEPGEGYIGVRGGVPVYLAAIVATCNARIRELHPSLFVAQTPALPEWLTGEHPATIQLVQQLLSIKLVNNQLTL